MTVIVTSSVSASPSQDPARGEDRRAETELFAPRGRGRREPGAEEPLEATADRLQLLLPKLHKHLLLLHRTQPWPSGIEILQLNPRWGTFF